MIGLVLGFLVLASFAVWGSPGRWFYGATYCVRCAMHRPVGEHGEFRWDDGSNQRVGT